MSPSNYFLERPSYTWGNALFWGNFTEHRNQANLNWQRGHMGKWAVHSLISAVEFLPIISQIASIFEKLIASIFEQPTLFKAIPFIPSEGPKRQLRALPPNNHPEPLALSPTTTFYPFNSEGVDDYGWGCAWRCCQTILSSYGIDPGFKIFFHAGGHGPSLALLYERKYGRKLPCERPWAPYDISSGWADPFIGHMLLERFYIDSELATLHGLPSGCNSPTEVFHNHPFNFSVFQEKLRIHFERENAPPVMIDNGVYALNIIGITLVDGKTKLSLADPHIKPTAESRNGLYEVWLDHEGKQIESSVNPNQKEELYGDGAVVASLSFDASKKWMILFPKLLKPQIFVGDMEIYIKHIDGKTYSLNVNSSDTTELIREQLAYKSKIPVELGARILYDAWGELGDGYTLADRNIQNKSTLHVSLRLPGNRFQQALLRDDAAGS